MAAAEIKLPVLESAAAGVAFLRQHWREALVVALIAAAASTALSLLAVAMPGLVAVFVLLDYAVTACAYAALISLALGQGPLAAPRALADGALVWGAMAVVGFFLLIVCVVAVLPSAVILSVALAPFRDRLESLGAQPDPNAVGALFADAFQANPFPFLLVILAYLAVWMFLTSRLYLSAPATVAKRAILTFDTWPWTKNNMLRILGARLVLLAPAIIIVVAVQRFAGAALGVNTFDQVALGAFASANPAAYGVLQFVGQTAIYFGLVTLEAGLSSNLFLRLRGAAKP
jgi:hypothetical protein